MSQTICCRLCLNTCTTQLKQLYEDNGCRNLEAYSLICRFLQPKFLNKLSDICLPCWHRISNFYDFQNNFILHRSHIGDKVKCNKAYLHKNSSDISLFSTKFKAKKTGIAKSKLNGDTDFLLADKSTVVEILYEDGDMVIKSLDEMEQPKESFKQEEVMEMFTYKAETNIQPNIKYEITTEETVINFKNKKIPASAEMVAKSQDNLDKIIYKWKPNLICGICQAPHSDFSHLVTHFSLEHPNQQTFILCCDRKLLNRAEIAKHAMVHISANALKRVQENHGSTVDIKSSRKAICSICGRACSSEGYLRLHMSMHSKEEMESSRLATDQQHRTVCGICGKVFKSERFLRQHRLTHTKLDIDSSKHKVCSVCEKVFKSEQYLRQHMSTHMSEPCYKCGCCPQTFRHHNLLYVHIKKQHPQKWSERKNIPNFLESMRISVDFPSNEDDATISSNDKMTQNEDIYIVKWLPAINCGICQEPCSNFNQLTQHFIRLHPIKKAYIVCCKRKIMKRCMFLEHATYHENPNTFKCKTCGKCFKSHILLTKHMKWLHSSR